MNTIDKQNYQRLVYNTNRLYTKAQEEWFSLHNVSYGDNVRILKEFHSGCYGFVGAWNSLMSRTIGKVGTIIDSGDNGLNKNVVLVKFDTGECWSYPFFVLDPIRQLKIENKQLILHRKKNMEPQCIRLSGVYNKKSHCLYLDEENKYLINSKENKIMFFLKNKTLIEYLQAQTDFIQNNNITGQTKFKIIDNFSDGKYGWCSDRKLNTKKLINSIVTYAECNQYGIRVYDFNDHKFYVPFFVLEKVEEPILQFKDKEVVLVRDGDDEYWQIRAFKEHDHGSEYPYVCYSINGITGWKQCIPYEDHERLLGTKYPPNF